MIDWAAVRADFPAVTSSTYLNTAAGGPICRAVAAAGTDYYRATLEKGDVHWDGWLTRVDRIREMLAGQLGCSSGEVGFVANASVGMNLVAQMLWGQGKVIAVRGDFPSVTLPWMQMGYEVTFVDPDDRGIVTRDQIAAAIDEETAIVAIGSVNYQTGFRHDLTELGELCRNEGLHLVVDATQQVGAVRLDLSTDNVDFLVASGYKWLTAGYGVGFLYVNRRHLHPEAFPAAGWRSARVPYDLLSDRLDLSDNAAALELGHPPFAAVFALGAALELFESVGPAAVERRVLELSAYAAERIAALGHQVVTPADEQHRAGITSARIDSPAELKRTLADDLGIHVSARGDALRVSTHLFNDESDVDRLAEALQRLR